MKIYILGSNDRAAIACIHSLKNFNVSLNIIYGNHGCPSLQSKYLDSKHYISQTQKLDKTLHQIRMLVPRGALLIPVNDYYLEFTLRFFEELSNDFHLSYGDKRSTMRLINKQDLQHVAASVDIDVPKTWLVSSLEDVGKLATLDLSFPVIVKPVKSCMVVNDFILSTSVKNIVTLEKLTLELTLNINNIDYMVQEYIPGSGSALNFFAVNGEIKVAFQYERIHEPGFGGGSSYRKSVPLDEGLLNKSKALLREYNFTGMGMIEFRSASLDGRQYLMEINARPWGSLALPIFAGIDFPSLVLKYHLGEDFGPLDYRTGVYARNITKDVNWLVRNGFRRKGPLAIFEPIFALGNFFKRTETFDGLAAHDSKPFLKGIVNVGLNASSIIWRKIISQSLLYRQGAECTAISQRVASLVKSKKVCFVCRGNIIRSKYAQLYYEKVTGRESVSCGTFFSENRNSPPVAVEVALRRGFNLNSMTSKTMFSMLDLDDYVFFVMDEKNLYDLKFEFRAENVFLLSVAAGKKGPILDPYRHAFNADKYHDAFAQIENYVDKIFGATS